MESPVSLFGLWLLGELPADAIDFGFAQRFRDAQDGGQRFAFLLWRQIAARSSARLIQRHGWGKGGIAAQMAVSAAIPKNKMNVSTNSSAYVVEVL